MNYCLGKEQGLYFGAGKNILEGDEVEEVNFDYRAPLTIKNTDY